MGDRGDGGGCAVNLDVNLNFNFNFNLNLDLNLDFNFDLNLDFDSLTYGLQQTLIFFEHESHSNIA